MDWSRPARALHNQVRGLVPWPAAVTELGGNRCKVFSASVLGATTSAAPGTILAAGKEGIRWPAGKAQCCVDELQADGGKRMKGRRLSARHPIPVDDPPALDAGGLGAVLALGLSLLLRWLGARRTSSVGCRPNFRFKWL